jgi:hypothetical protein
MADLIFLLTFVSAVSFNVAAWLGFRKVKSSLAPSQKKRTIVGLLANLLAFVLPVIYALSANLTNAVRWDYVLLGCWALCALSLVLAVLGPRRVRVPLLVASFAVALFWTMIPMGVL